MSNGDMRKKPIPIESFSKKVEMFPYYVYDNQANKSIGSIFLTRDQADMLNKMMQRNGATHQRYAFLLGWG